MIEPQIRMKTVGLDSHTAYVSLPGHRHEPGIVKRTIDLAEIVKDYKGPRILLDFDKEATLIGIEILCSIANSPGLEDEDDEGETMQEN
ncbi:MAG: hypothetical protein ABSH20_23540 [Tepidisphaeraceae bacterium]|jgi:hypothetical protein